MSKIAVLGASGFIGAAIVEHAVLEPGIRQVFALQHHSLVPESKDGRVKVLNGSLSDLPQELYAADTLFHAARQASSKGRIGRLLRSLSGQSKNERLANRLITMNVHVWYVSGSLMYGNSRHPVDETAALDPISFARMYQYAERPFVRISQQSHQGHILRVPWVLGNGSWFQRFYLEPMLHEGYIPLYGKGDNVMTFIDRSDLGSAAIRISRIPQVSVANLFMDDYISQEMFAEILHTLSGLPIRRHSDTEVLRMGGSALLEAFTSNIHLNTIHDACRQVLAQNRFATVEEMLRVRLPEFGLR